MKPKEGKFYIASGFHVMPGIKDLDLKCPFDTFESAYESIKIRWDDCWSIIATYREHKWYLVDYNETHNTIHLNMVNKNE